MSELQQRSTASAAQVPGAADISVAVLYPGNRAEKMTVPLQASAMEVAVEPADAYERDIVICDNADRALGREVLKKYTHDATLIYRMRGDVFHELDLWDMHPAKEWVARHGVLAHVDGAIAVSDRLAEKFAAQTGTTAVGSAGLWKRVSEWPDTTHTDSGLRPITLTNANYWQKVKAIVDVAPVVDDVLQSVGGRWVVGADGEHTDKLDIRLREFDHVDFEGYVDAESALERANIMLHPSYLDGQPNSMLEGMASGLPVVTNDFAAFTRYDGPITVARSTDDFRAALRRFTDPSERQMAGDENRRYIARHHTPAAIARDYERFFVEVADGGPS